MITDRRSVLAGLALIAATPAAMAQAQKVAPATPLTDFAGVKTARTTTWGCSVRQRRR